MRKPLASDSHDDLIGDIYEAAALPELWPGVLDRLAGIADLVGGILFTTDPAQNVRWTSSLSLREFMHAAATGGWGPRNSRAARLAPRQHPGPAPTWDLFTPEEMDRDPFYTELLRPSGLGWGAGTIVPVPTGDMLVITVEGRSGPVSRDATAALDRLRPHLARAACCRPACASSVHATPSISCRRSDFPPPLSGPMRARSPPIGCLRTWTGNSPTGPTTASGSSARPRTRSSRCACRTLRRAVRARAPCRCLYLPWAMRRRSFFILFPCGVRRTICSGVRLPY